MQLMERVWLVGSGSLGNEISHRMDCNVYLVKGGEEYALIDAGSGADPLRIIANIEQLGVSMEQVKHVLLTHIHGDHAAGAYYFHQHYGMEIICSSEAAPWLEGGDMEKTSILPAKRAGVYPEDFHFPACPVARSVSEGDVIAVGDFELKVINTPGHSRGHISFLSELNGQRCLFAGDSVFAGGRIVLQNIWDCSIQDYAETVHKLHLLRVDCLLAGHGTILLSEAWRHVELAHNHFTRLGLPPNL